MTVRVDGTGSDAYLELVEDLPSSALPDGLRRFDHGQEEPDGLVGKLSEDHQDQLRQDVVDFDVGVPDARDDLGESGVPLQDRTSEHEARDVCFCSTACLVDRDDLQRSRDLHVDLFVDIVLGKRAIFAQIEPDGEQPRHRLVDELRAVLHGLGEGANRRKIRAKTPWTQISATQGNRREPRPHTGFSGRSQTDP